MDVHFSLENINEAAKTFIEAIGQKKIVAMHGEMGAGKTTFVHAVCDVLGVEDSISSPTFSIINEYTTSNNESIFHIDLYRLKSYEEAQAAGVDDCIHSRNLCFIEWPEIAPALFDEHTVHVYLTDAGNNKRGLKIKM